MKNACSSERRPRGRPRQFDRNQAIATALTLFKQRGYEGTSIAHLTEAIGVSATSLYGAFPSKEALFEEAIELYQETEGAFAALALNRGETTLEAIRDLLMEAAINYAGDNHSGGCFISLGVLSCAPEHREIANRMTARRLAARDAIKLRIERGKDLGELRAATDADTLAAFYAATLQGMSIQARDGATIDDLEQIAHLALSPLAACRAI